MADLYETLEVSENEIVFCNEDQSDKAEEKKDVVMNYLVAYNVDLAWCQLMDKYDLTPQQDEGQPILFGQKAITPKFSVNGHFKGAYIDDVADMLLNGEMSEKNLEVKYIWVNGNKVAVNNRSLAVLSKANKTPVTYRDVTTELPKTDIEIADSIINILYRLEEIDGEPSDKIGVREMFNRRSSVKENIELCY